MTILALIRIFKQVDSPIQYLTSVRQGKNVDPIRGCGTGTEWASFERFPQVLDPIKNLSKLAQTHILAIKKMLSYAILKLRGSIEISFKNQSKLAQSNILGRHRCWWRMLEMKCVGDNFEVLAVFVTKILYPLT